MDPLILNRINAQLSQKSERVHPFKVFVLKCLADDKSVNDLQDLCKKKTQLFPWLGMIVFIFLPDCHRKFRVVQRASYSNAIWHFPNVRILRWMWECLPEYPPCKIFYYFIFLLWYLFALSRSDNNVLAEMLEKCISSDSHRRAILGYVANHFYFVNTFRTLNAGEIKVLDWLKASPTLAKLPQPSQTVLHGFVSNRHSG